jgi:transcriptional regulator with XRE-family HTH domain
MSGKIMESQGEVTDFIENKRETYKALAELLGMSPVRLSRLKNGRGNALELSVAKKLAAFFNTDCEIWFKGGDIESRRVAIAIKIQELLIEAGKMRINHLRQEGASPSAAKGANDGR